MGIQAILDPIIAGISGIGGAVSGAVGAGVADLGITGGLATALTGAGAGALEGGALGAGEALLTGGKPLKGAEFGALTGGAIGGLGPVLGGVTGLGTTAGDALAGAGAGALGGKLTGGSPLTGALEGGAGGLATGLLTPSAPTTGTAGTAGGVGGAAATAAPSGSGIGSLGTSDITQLGAGIGVSPTGGVGGGLGSSSILAPTGVATAPAAAGAGGGAATGGAGGILSSLTKSPGILLAGAGLGLDLLKGNQQTSEEKALKTQAAQLTAEGTQNSNYLATGTLPPGVQQSVNTAADNAAATIRSQYAARGQSGSSAELQDLQNIQNTVATQGANIATGLLQQGISETNMADSIYAQLMQVQLQQDAQLSSSIGNFASSLALGSRPLTTGTTASA